MANKKDIDKVVREYRDEIDQQLKNLQCKYPRHIQLSFGELFYKGADPKYLKQCLGVKYSTLLRWERVFLSREIPKEAQTEPLELDENVFEEDKAEVAPIEAEVAPIEAEDTALLSSDWYTIEAEVELAPIEVVVSGNKEEEKEDDVVEEDENEAEVTEFKECITDWLKNKTGTAPMLWESPDGYRLVSVCETQMKRLMKGVVQSSVDDLLT